MRCESPKFCRDSVGYSRDDRLEVAKAIESVPDEIGQGSLERLVDAIETHERVLLPRVLELAYECSLGGIRDVARQLARHRTDGNVSLCSREAAQVVLTF